MRNNVVIEEAGDDLELLADETPFIFTEAQRRHIEELWAAEKARRGSNLYDAPIMSFERRNGSRITGRFLQYKELMAVRRDPEILPGREVLTIGVNGLIVAGGRAVFAQRARHVTGYPGFYEAIPSGGVDKTFLAGGQVDYRAHLAKELLEETGVGSAHIRSMETFAFILDRDDRAYDICVEIKTNLDAGSFSDLVRSSGQHEYDHFEYVPLYDLNHFVTDFRARILPTTIAILSVRGLIRDPAAL